ncbi:Squamosa promoter-binding-like protein 11 [Platanthera guangdongensis]|uniref:Squamosa promoter-binding-like protein 11 n=1 Tax=Platanthera guangdongensis TaxID=2320717 RepID=A0ABR2MMG2_9ASPA
MTETARPAGNKAHGMVADLGVRLKKRKMLQDCFNRPSSSSLLSSTEAVVFSHHLSAAMAGGSARRAGCFHLRGAIDRLLRKQRDHRRTKGKKSPIVIFRWMNSAERPSFPKQSPISDINQRSSGRRQFPALLRHWTASRFSFFINESPLVVFLAQLRGMRVSGVEGSDMDNGGSSSAPGRSADTFKPLQFGRKIYADDDAAAGGSSSKSLTVPALPEVRPSAATGKKAKCAAQGFGQSPPPPMPKCQVEGCDLDLKGSKSYYCRHKVCGMHSKSPKVIVAGLEQRFCQQCSRCFPPLLL